MSLENERRRPGLPGTASKAEASLLLLGRLLGGLLLGGFLALLGRFLRRGALCVFSHHDAETLLQGHREPTEDGWGCQRDLGSLMLNYVYMKPY